MSWQFDVPGQPPSVNHMYARSYSRRGAVRKTPGAESYQAVTTMIVRTERPSGWEYTGGYIRLTYDLHLAKDMDCDNVLKVLNDAIAVGLNVNDRNFLPCVRSKESGLKEPYVTVTVEYP